MKPGVVTCPLRTAPPTVSSASSSRTSHPASARALAATRPFGPAPMTTASAVSADTSLDCRRRGCRGGDDLVGPAAPRGALRPATQAHRDDRTLRPVGLAVAVQDLVGT